jgi:DNA-binding NarL/FixJ family response regulator
MTSSSPMAPEALASTGSVPLRPPLTPRELDVLTRIACGDGATRAAHLLGISERTVHKHLERSYAKLGVHDRLMAVRRMFDLGMIRIDEAGDDPLISWTLAAERAPT